jgi:hypothetical protein
MPVDVRELRQQQRVLWRDEMQRRRLQNFDMK